MGLKMKKIFTILFLSSTFFFSSLAEAQAVKIPPLKLCTNGETVIAKKKCNASETQLNLSSLIGANGSNGQNGANGTLDPNKCTRRESTATGSGAIVATVPCLVSEIVTASGCDTTGFGEVVENKLVVGSNSQYPEAYHLVQCIAFASSGTYSATAQAYCCRP